MKLITLLLLLTFFSNAFGGRILNGDLWVDYANAGSMK